MRACWLLATCMLLAACSATRVHIFDQTIEAAQLDRLTSELRKAGFETEQNTLAVPQSILGPTLLYSPEHSRLGDIERLGELLLSLGYDIALEPVSRGNHFYTGSNVGLYLRPGRREAQPGKDSFSGREFNGDCDDLDAYLQFAANQRFRLEFIEWDPAEEAELISSLEGRWDRHGNEVTLIANGELTRLEVLPLHNETQYGSVSGIRLLNRSGKLKACSFVWRSIGSL